MCSLGGSLNLEFENTKNHSTTSKDAGRFAHILRACKKSQYNVHNCKSRRHNQRHTFWHHNARYKPSLTNIPYYSLKVKERKDRKTKLLLLINKIGCLVLTILNKIQVTITCRWIQAMITIHVLISYIVKVPTKLIQVLIYRTK